MEQRTYKSEEVSVRLQIQIDILIYIYIYHLEFRFLREFISILKRYEI